MKKLFGICVCILILSFSVSAQTGVLKGFVRDAKTNIPLIGANVLVTSDTGTVTDENGFFIFDNIKPGLYDIQVSYIGYTTEALFEIEVQGVKPTILEFMLKEDSGQLDEVVVKASSFRRTSESPLSLRNIGVSEIKRNPGGNRDISRVIQSLPGVTSTASFRNDLIIRGGAPNENRFFIDDVEVPNINHFATQGSSGGPAGLLNVDFIREVDFFSGAFPVSRGNSLSSVFNFKLKDGRDDRLGFTATAGATDLGIAIDGPLGEKSTFLFSARRSYLQFLFKAIGLPFLPTYTDFNAKYKYKIDNKNEIYFIGIGAIDDFVLNKDANETESKQYLLNQLPVNTQWNYTNGIVYKRYHNNGFTNFVLSRNMLNNEAVKYLNNDESDEKNLILDYKSQEIENKLRIESFRTAGKWEFLVGTGYEFVKYNNSTFNKIFTNSGAADIQYTSAIDFHKYSVFGNISRKFFNDNLTLSGGIRMDGNSFSDAMQNPMEQFSPRISASWKLDEAWSLNFNTGRYYQLPPYTILGYQDDRGFVNKNATYIQADHIVAGIELNTTTSSRITLEGYYKKYNNYPFLLRDRVSLANLGGDFGVIGNEPSQSTSVGRTYGLEFLFQQRLYKGFYGIVAYTLGFSEFQDVNGKYVPSSWDSRHIINLTAGKRFGKDWEFGLKWRYQDGLPSTPFSPESDLVFNWDRNARGIPDYTRLNSRRDGAFNALDIRLDKKWFFKGWDLNLYIDIQNITSSVINREVLILDRPLDDNNMPVGEGIILNPDSDPADQRYKLKSISDASGNVLPTIGIVISI
ncbi:MAG: TonB-dependent receptor [Saprospiraceae bacterium]|nr:TonB-dependent receptor [Saprospiraceae bacterium]